MNLRTKTVLIIGLSISILAVGLLTTLSQLLSAQIHEKESFTLTYRLREFLQKPSTEPLELTNQDQLCRAGGDSQMEINVIYPNQADFAPQLQKLETNGNGRNRVLIDRVKGIPRRVCDRPQPRQTNSLSITPSLQAPNLSQQLPSPVSPVLGQQQPLAPKGARELSPARPKEKTFSINGEPVQIDQQTFQLANTIPPPTNRDTSKSVALLMRNAKGEPVAVMQLLSPSPFSDVTENITKAFLVLGIGLLFFSVILYFILDRFVLSRISRLNQQVGKIKGDLQNPGQIKLEGKDELANLAKSINRMLQRQINFQNQLYQAKKQIEITNQQLALANQELEHLAKTDGLTQIMNRRFFQINLEEIWQKCLQQQLPVSLILCDVDFFKLYNDTYGHLAGDICLQKVAKAMQTAVSIEPRAIVARYGGEEFVVILPHIEMQRSVQVAEAMRAAIRQLKLPHSASKVADFVTLSIGVSTLIPQPHLSPRDLIGQADQHLYHAKANGRNRVIAQVFESYTSA